MTVPYFQQREVILVDTRLIIESTIYVLPTHQLLRELLLEKHLIVVSLWTEERKALHRVDWQYENNPLVMVLARWCLHYLLLYISHNIFCGTNRARRIYSMTVA